MRNFKLVTLAILMASMILFMNACGGGRIYIDPPPLPATELIIELLPDNSVSIRKTKDLNYDLDFVWNDGLIITNNDHTLVNFIIISKEDFKGYSYGIIERNMTTAALDIPLNPGKNECLIDCRLFPENEYSNEGYIDDRYQGRIIETPDGLKHIENQVVFSFSMDIKAFERHRIFREHNLFIFGVKPESDSSELRYWCKIKDGRDPVDVVAALEIEPSVISASVYGIFSED